ncbi:hypothetical protein ACTOV9_02405 [Legionella pneumophila]|uniref:Uncharacterized protein n=4 Tax=Legionella TaxID=445 RepID=A0A222P386_9GAMM|nr:MULTISPECIES: hypothetical protein [Legionella]AMV13735.1 hypothetical protein ULM_10520 [Legionella pneumophila]ANN92036.1 hypothetical protein A9P85_05125 [Legionella pneumophila]ASQ46287.1 hypothetical protein clem_08675 [Legionella clemsonensis]MCK1850702.1 hypothetical protein [Legionella pneumophila]MDI9853316.1 hypothetical protein [Legionella pneumophila]
MFDFENQDSVLNYDSKQFKRSPDDTVIITDKDPTMFMLTYCTAAIIFNATTQQSILFHYTPAWGPQTHSENKLKIDEFLKIPGQKEAVIITQHPSQSTSQLREMLQKYGIPSKEHIPRFCAQTLIIKYDPMTLEVKTEQGNKVTDCSFKSNTMVQSKRKRENPVLSEDFLKDKAIFDKIKAGKLSDLIKSFDDVWQLASKFPDYFESFLNYAFNSLTDSKIDLLLCLKTIKHFPNLSEIVLSRIEQGKIISYEKNLKTLEKIIEFIKSYPTSANIFKSIIFDIVQSNEGLKGETVQSCINIFPDLNKDPNIQTSGNLYRFHSPNDSQKNQHSSDSEHQPQP